MAKQKVTVDSTSSSTGQRVGLRYLGGGYLPGLPARDLNAAELVEYADLIAQMEQAGTLGQLYEEVTSTSSVTVEEGTNNA